MVPAQHHGVTLVSKNQSWLMTIAMVVLAAAAVIAVVRFVIDPMGDLACHTVQPNGELVERPCYYDEGVDTTSMK